MQYLHLCLQALNQVFFSVLFRCKECNKVLADDNSLRNHMYRRHVSKEDLKFECNMCEKKFAKKYVLDGHLLTHRKPDNLITCELCQKG